MSVDTSAQEYARYRTQVEIILHTFDFERCHECGYDLQYHAIEPDVLGNAGTRCLIPNTDP